MLPFLSYYSLSLFLGGIVALSSGLLVFLSGSNKKSNIIWLFLTISTAVWSFGYYSMIISPDKPAAILSDIILHIGASFIPLFYFIFIIIIAESFEKYKKLLYLLIPGPNNRIQNQRLLV